MTKKQLLEQKIRQVVREVSESETFTVVLQSKEIELSKEDFKQFVAILKKNGIKYDVAVF